jgi:phosphate transport system protein
VFDELFRIFSDSHPLKSAGEQFSEMLSLVQGMIRTASSAYWGSHLTPSERQQLYDTDIRVNQLQRRIRQQVILHLSGPTTADVSYGLMLMSLVKDAERLGDYAKDLTEVHETSGLSAGDLPEGELRDELKRITEEINLLSAQVPEVYQQGDRVRAQQLARAGKQSSRACDELLRRIAASSLSAAMTLDLVLAARYYKRIAGHLLNLLSSVLMPLHKLDYLDEER